MSRWFVLLGCFVGMSVAPPAILLVPMGLFQKSVTAEFNWSRTDFSLLLAMAVLSNAITLPIAGYLVDRFGSRWVIAIGTALGCSFYAALSMAASYGAFAATLILCVATGTLASYPAFMGLAQRWFDRRLGLALAITSTGLAVGNGVSSYAITRIIDAHGWRAAFLTVGIGALIIGVANVLLLVRDNRGPIPEMERRLNMVRVGADGSSLAQALRTRHFWLYTASFLLIVFASVGCNVQIPALLSDRGASASEIALVVTVIAAGSLVGRLFTGIMLDRFSVRRVASLFFLSQAVGFLLLLNGFGWAFLAGFLLGAVQGAEIDILGYVIARRFGRFAYSRISGTCFAVTLLGAIAGPILMAKIFDRTGSYDAGLLLLPLCSVLALGLLYLASSPARTDAVPASSSQDELGAAEDSNAIAAPNAR